MGQTQVIGYFYKVSLKLSYEFLYITSGCFHDTRAELSSGDQDSTAHEPKRSTLWTTREVCQSLLLSLNEVEGLVVQWLRIHFPVQGRRFEPCLGKYDSRL